MLYGVARHKVYVQVAVVLDTHVQQEGQVGQEEQVGQVIVHLEIETAKLPMEIAQEMKAMDVQMA